MASPMPVLPLVGSTITPPGFSLPDASASSTIDRAMRSLIDAPGLDRSDLIHTSAPWPNSRLIRMCGVLPMVSRMLAAFIRGLLWDRLNWLAWRRLQASGAAGDDGRFFRRRIG